MMILFTALAMVAAKNKLFHSHLQCRRAFRWIVMVRDGGSYFPKKETNI
jgi:hypothetical protein